jgi:hypothetical protein
MLVKDLKAMKEKKYYAPTIEELHVGMELQYAKNDGPEHNLWKDMVFNELNFGDLANTAIRVRVKQLDKEDIEAEGWKHIERAEGFPAKFRFETPDGRKFNLWLTPDGVCSIDHVQAEPFWIHNMFNGKIKNKSRLRLVMEMVGII